MKLAYLVNQYPAISHTFVRREIQELERLGYQVVRYSIRDMSDAVIGDEDLREAELTTHLLDIRPALLATMQLCLWHPIRAVRAMGLAWRLWRNAGSRFLRHMAYLLEAAHLSASLQQEGVEHLHVHFGTNSASVAVLARCMGGPSFSFTVHGPEEFDRPLQESLTLKIDAAAFVVAISSFGRSQLQRWCPFEQWDKIHVVHCGLPSSSFQDEPIDLPDVTRVVCVGRLCEQKGHFVLVQAVRQLAAQISTPFEVVLVGDGEFRSALEDQIQTWDLAKYFRFVGWQTEEQVQDWLNNSRCFVLPSFAEGLPVVLMEAFAAGRPVITTYVAGIPELVQEGTNGWLVPAADSGALATAMRAALETPTDQLTRMGQAGRSRAHERHCVETQVPRLVQAIEAV